MKNIHIFRKKLNFGEKFKSAAKNQNGVDRFFLNSKSTETPSSGFIRDFLMQIC
jgi:hypothetical protein